MTTSKNRSIRTADGFNEEGKMTLAVEKAGKFKGRDLQPGQLITLSRSDAKAALKDHKELFSIKTA